MRSFSCGHFIGIHNYDDQLFLGIDVCIYLREHLLNHSSISSLADSYNSMFYTNIAHQRVLSSYLTFDGLSSGEAEYFCNICGDHPWVLAMGLNKKNCFKFPVNEIVSNESEC